MAGHIKAYMNGKTTKDQFSQIIRDNNIPMNEKINTLIRNTEAGNTPSFQEFGKLLLREMNGLDKYNRVDKISSNNNRIVTPGHAGRTFGLA